MEGGERGELGSWGTGELGNRERGNRELGSWGAGEFRSLYSDPPLKHFHPALAFRKLLNHFVASPEQAPHVVFKKKPVCQFAE